MKILFIGGSGVISRAATELTLAQGHELWLLNRGQRRPIPGVRSLVADIANPEAARAALRGHSWDVVVEWIGFTPADVRRDLGLFRDCTRQYVFISSASVYQKPLGHYLITESTPRANPHWEYSRQKIACELELEAAYRDTGFPAVIVRPSLTYGEDQVPLVLNAWNQSWTTIDRMRRGAPVIIPGDGSSLWTITHNTDFAAGIVGLFGNPATLGHAFHITSDEVLTWNQIFQQAAEAAGVKTPRFVHIPSDFIISCVPAVEGTLLGDKAVSAVFDNTKIKRFVPGFTAKTRFADGIRKTIAWFDADPARQQIDAATNARWDKLVAAYEAGCALARERFAAA
ncbi:SDR family oxidoreductase [Opitutus sp. ER46]|uniref:SDR family oxidoreductase n=1 Tax=Opitutus sp. ER46 TaxID=2161864 RepID=UPI000D328540|nr:SDR family oxidoreductase [Opitutus sp. ER46]PTX94200.1 NAD-dependent dehydratase [Opitutus sp. ER46]